MIALRRTVVALFLVGLGGCGSGSNDAVRDPNSPVVKDRADKIEHLKARAAAKGGRPAP